MATLTDAEMIAWANGKVRAVCGILLDAKNLIDSIVNDAAPNSKNMAVRFSEIPTCQLDDGSLPGGAYPGSPDGRTPLTCADISAAITAMQTLKSTSDTVDGSGNSMTALLHKIGPTGR